MEFMVRATITASYKMKPIELIDKRISTLQTDSYKVGLQ